ncbi:unnamed protein product [Adineta steineri]|uniref:Multicopper oxidase n=1 Tax=Adineta steineri TaxID=433720 RepID=A0A819D1S4_9BILA|nr:unnamed protein product [Adineta steineri]CAF1329722.1 unnamed protein product [Adineta steineri]CAF3653296.1 unnamed protein product [Adineta steineri]CAF3821600.1 unnamed protein product [Adineta steineri]
MILLNYLSNNRLFHSFYRTTCILSIKLWHILLFICVSIVIIVIGLISIYLRNKNLRSNSIEQNVNVYNNTFHIGWFNASPDNYERSILSINSKLIAPTILVNQGDIINLTIINESFEPITIHWHGLLQMNTLDMDGVPGVTQCSIEPNETFLYKYKTMNQSGTYWYHSHYSIQYGDGLKGILIIKDVNDPFQYLYEDEDILQLTDWYHIPLHILLRTYLSPGMLDPVPDSSLINGIGQFNCTLNKTCSYYRSFIRIGTTKRLRIINTSVYAKITLTIDQHQMRIIEADGIYLDGNKYVKTLRLNPGQRYSILITANKQFISQTYWIRTTIHPFVDYNNQYNSSIQPNAYAILQYINNDDNMDININNNLFPSINSLTNDDFIINQSISNGEIFSDESGLIPMNLQEYKVPKSPNIRTFIFDSKHQGSNPGYFYFNNQTFIHPINETLLSLLIYKNSSSAQLSWPLTISIETNDIIDIIINNIDYASHPFHLHGHHVWILAQGNSSQGYFNQSTYNNIIYNEQNPIYRDTFTVNPYSYLVFRFKANNPGIWMLHCHNDWHLQVGMALIFIESSQLIKQYYLKNNLTNSIPKQCYHY